MRRPERAARVALSALFTGAAAIAFAPIFVRLSEVGPVATAFYRLALALPALWLWMTLERRHHPHTRRPCSFRDYRNLILPGLFFAGDLGIWHWSIQFTTVANATLLANFAPVFVTLAAWLLFHERCTRMFLVGLVTALLGAGLVVGLSWEISVERLFGDMLGLVTALFYAGYIVSVKTLRSRYSVATIMTYSALTGSLLLLPAALLSGENLCVPSAGGWLVLAALALLSHVGGQGLIAFALAHLPAPFSSVSLLLQPVIAAGLAWAILHEGVAPWQATGGFVVLLGIYLARRGSRSI